jgi:Zn-dependent oligopeptidase
MLKQKLLFELSKKGLINYKLLAGNEALKCYPEMLVELLHASEKKFDHILTTKKSNLNFTNVVGNYLDMDSALNVLYGFIESLNATNNSPQTRKIIEDFQPKIVDYCNKITLSPAYYRLLKSLKSKKLNADQKRSVQLIMKDMEMAGVHVNAQKRKELEKINKELSRLGEKFENNVIDSRKEFFHEFKTADRVKDMSASDLKQSEEEAKRRKSKAKYVFTLSPPSLTSILKYCSDRKVRQLFYKKNFTIASSGPHDNRALILDILKLRQRKAALLGYKNYAKYIFRERMAKNPLKIEKIYEDIYKKASRKANIELQKLKDFAGQKKLEDWDISYYSEKLKQHQFGIDQKELKKFFPLEKVRGGLFEITAKLFGLTFEKLNQAGYSEDIETFKVLKGGKLLAYYVADFYAHPSKRGGAWCNHLRRGGLGKNKEAIIPIVINVMNFPKGTKEHQSLLSHRDVETLFHEFGHALHLIFSSHSYFNLSGFQTEWDFVEFPSQLLENWCWEEKSINLFARHYQTGRMLPKDKLKKLQASKTFMSGWMVVRQLEFAFLDLKLHTQNVPGSVTVLDKKCQQIVQKYNALKKFPGYKMYTSFDHIFAGGYAAGYYSYIWSEMLEADLFEYIKKQGILNSRTGSRYANEILAPGAKKSGMELFRDFMGRGVRAQAFMRKHALEKNE